MSQNKIGIATYCVSEGKDTKSTNPHQLPIYATSSFEMPSVDAAVDIFTGRQSGHVYSRYGNPTIDTVAHKIAALEGFGLDESPYGFLTSSGMSAIAALGFALLKKGDAVLTQGNLYGGTTELFIKVFQRMGVAVHFVDFDEVENVRNALKTIENIKLVYVESPTNPTISCVDLRAVAEAAKMYGAWTAIDNTFCTPYLQQPFRFGLDFVIHSTTKYLNGHGNSIAGAVVGLDPQFHHAIWQTVKLMGLNTNPWDAWLINNGLKTLALRMEKHCDNAAFIAHKLNELEGIRRVNYCGLPESPYYAIAAKQMNKFGGMLSFEIDGGLEEAKRFIDALEVCTHAPTLGDVDTLVLHPVTSSHLNVDADTRKKYGITDGLIRMSVGIEDKEDLLADVVQALNKV